jgi:hypothetical protein
VTHVGYLVAGYGLTTAVLLAYVLRLRWRGRALAARPSTGPARDEATAAATPPSQADVPAP